MSVATAATVLLPRADGSLGHHTVGAPTQFARPREPLRSRTFFAAAHIVGDPLVEPDGSGRARLDWEGTLAFRRHLWSWGLGVAEAMDTAQRGMGLDWLTSAELIRRSCEEGRAVGGRIACGAGTDQLQPGRATLDAIIAAYCEQCALVEEAGAQVILMASRALAASAKSPDDFRRVYDAVLDQIREPVILHWLGEVFDPLLAGYWGSSDIEIAMDVVVSLITDHLSSVEGIKISLLDDDYELMLRERLPDSVRVYTGDDYNYPSLIKGDGSRSSDALLGIFDPIAPAASAALQALDQGDADAFEGILEPTLPLAQHIFSSPTSNYKTGIVFLAYLNGHQEHFRMVGGLESARSAIHLSEVFRLADRAGLLVDPELAVARIRQYLVLAGVTA